MAITGPETSSIARIVASRGREPVLDVVLDRLDDHDRVVDHDPDRQHQAEERQVIEAEPERGHDGERADDRHRHGDQRDHRRPPVLQEQQHHDRHQDDRVAQGLEDLADRFADERRGVVADLVVSRLAGSPFSSSSIFALTMSAVSRALASGSWKTRG